MKKQNFHIGISGWNYDDFKGIFYPEKLKSNERLNYYSKFFTTVEINSTFYRIPNRKVFEKWYKITPQDFIFSVKLNRQFTHKSEFPDNDLLFKWFFESVSDLKNKLKVILVQLPPSKKFNESEFISFIKKVKKYTRKKLVVEPRHKSFFNENVYKLFKKLKIALCFSNTGGKYPEKLVKTSDFSYTRLHGPKELYASLYTRKQLKKYLEQIKSLNLKENYIYFDNTAYGYAVKNAIEFKKMVG